MQISALPARGASYDQRADVFGSAAGKLPSHFVDGGPTRKHIVDYQNMPSR